MAGQPLRLAIVATLTAKDVSAGAAEIRREVESVGQSTTASAAQMRVYAAANDEAAAAQRRAIDAARGRSAAETELQQSIARMTGMRPMLEDAGMGRRTADISAYGEALDDLRAKYNPLFAAERERERGLTAINQALRLGAISQDEHAAAVLRANAAYQQQVAVLDRARRAQGANDNLGGRRQNLGYQAFDIGQGVAAGAPIGIIAAQQLPQIMQLYAVQGGLNAFLRDTVGLFGAVARAAGPWIAAAAAIYGAYRLITSYSAEAALAIDDATAALAEQAAPLGTVRSLVSDLAGLQGTYREAMRASARDSTAASATIVANTEREFSAKRALLELELRRQEASIKAQQAELAVAALQQRRDVGQQVFTRGDLERQGFADPRAGSVPFVRLPDNVTGVEKTFASIAANPALDKIEELRANLTLTELAAEQLREAVKASFDGKPIDQATRSLGAAREVLSSLTREAEAYAEALDRIRGIARPALSDGEVLEQSLRSAISNAGGFEERQQAIREYDAAQRRMENERLGALVPTPTRRPNLEDSLPSGRDLIATQREQLETLRLEQMLVTSGTAARERAIAAMQAEQEIRRLGIDSAGEEAEAIRSNAVAIADQTSALERNEEAWRKSQSAAESMIDSLIDRLSSGDIEGALEGLARDLSKELLGLGAGNTIKNALLGGDRPTFADYGGPLGYLGALVGRRPATLTPTIAETGGGLLGMLGIDPPTGSGQAEKVIRLPPSPVTGTAGAASGSVARELLGYLADGRPSSYVTDMSGDLQAGLAAMLRDAPASVRSAVSITSGARSVERQAELWQQALTKYGSPEAARRWVAPPGRSQHNFGRAADLGFGNDEARQWFHSNAEGYGLRFPMGHEPWHIETANARGGNAGSRALDDLTAGAGRFGRAVDQVATSSVAAKDGIGALGEGAGQLGQNLARYFPPAPGAPAGGGIGGWLSGLLGGGAPSMASMSAFSPMAAAAISAGRGGLYWSGGWTGPGGKYDPKGVVHAGEYVLSAEATSAIGVGNLDKLHEAAKHGFAEGGYASGGAPMPESWRAPAGGSGWGGGPQQGLTVNLINQTSEPMRAERRRTPDGRGGWRDDVVLKRAAIDAVTGPEGRAAMGATYGMQATMPEL